MREEYHPQLEREERYEQSIRMYATWAEQLAKDFQHPANIWMAIRSEQGPDRTKIFADVAHELARRKKEQNRSHSTHARPLKQNARLYADAYANQQNQPPEAWNNSLED